MKLLNSFIIIILGCNFEYMAMANNFTLSEIEVYVNHILLWKKGYIMNPLTPQSIITLNPNYDHQQLKKAITEN